MSDQPQEAQALYTQESDGSFLEQQDLIYPPGTVFYVKSPDGSYEPANIEIGDDHAEELAAEITQESIIQSATDYLRAHGYTVVDSNTVTLKPVMDTDALYQLQVLLRGHLSPAALEEAYGLIRKLN